ncbi:hypothetical protein [Mixta sp. Marseille-Q2659]|uniref:hypothetical protein n=1 Tax=Mixta sp. Marseille-Q2659 TaxID=2736607 RepID=UPI0023BA21ED|nr:hypothetical protein [Mixta sp. Marseille-Q2659]
MKTASISLILIAVIMICFAAVYNHMHSVNTFKCTSQSRYHIAKNDADYNFYLTQTLQLYKDNTGFISFNGKAIHDGAVENVNRKVLLSDGFQIDNYTLKYHNAGMRKLATDSISNDTFQILFTEFSNDESTLILERKHIDHNAWLIGNPDVWVLTCVEY